MTSFEQKLWQGPYPTKSTLCGTLIRRGLERGLIFEIEGQKFIGLHGTLNTYTHLDEDQIIPPME